MNKNDYYSIEPARPDLQQAGFQYTVYLNGVYEESSVLAGQPRRINMDSFKTLEEAKKEYPQAEVYEHNIGAFMRPVVPHTPPSWFDPTIAGERWEADE